jgi:CelD/BcsL family acetyltransferase involved in cellulose biosynthesis
MKGGSPAAMRYEIISELSQWLAYRQAITELLSSSSNVLPHFTITWLTSWWKAFGEGQALRIGLFWEKDLLVGYAPLMLTEWHFLGIRYRKLHFIGEGLSDLSDYHDLFSRSDDLDIKSRLIGIILNEWEWDQLSLINIPENSNTMECFRNYRKRWKYLSIRQQVRCPYIDLRGRDYDQYLQTLSIHHRRELRRRQKKLSAMGPFTMEINAKLSPLDLFEKFKNLHTQRAGVKGWASMYDYPGFRDFFCDLLENRHQDLKVLYSTLHCGEILISYQLGFVSGRIYQSWNTGYRPEYASFSPVKLLTRFTIEECFRRGYDEFNYSRSDSKHKLLWTQTCRENFEICVLKQSGLRSLINWVKWIRVHDPGSRTGRLINFAKALLVYFRLRSPETQAADNGEDTSE